MAITLRCIVVGLGIQGHKRRAVAGAECVATVDPVHPDADYRRVEDVPAASYDAALVCTPDAPKPALLAHLLGLGKHVLVEKPLWADDEATLVRLQEIARASGALCRTAYNHRFEPHIRRMGDLISSGALGRIYSCRMLYGNGTAQLVRESVWRDQGAGVLPDLGSHLLDICRFWFGDMPEDFVPVSVDRFENAAPDHVVIGRRSGGAGGDWPRIELEMTLLMWRNHFTCDVLAENGSAHIRSLCKWGPSTFTRRTRVRPSGRPPEEAVTLVQDDPTWAAEYADFKERIAAGAVTDLSNDLWLLRVLRRLGNEAVR